MRHTVPASFSPTKLPLAPRRVQVAPRNRQTATEALCRQNGASYVRRVALRRACDVHSA